MGRVLEAEWRCIACSVFNLNDGTQHVESFAQHVNFFNENLPVNFEKIHVRC